MNARQLLFSGLLGVFGFAATVNAVSARAMLGQAAKARTPATIAFFCYAGGKLGNYVLPKIAAVVAKAPLVGYLTPVMQYKVIKKIDAVRATTSAQAVAGRAATTVGDAITGIISYTGGAAFGQYVDSKISAYLNKKQVVSTSEADQTTKS